MYKKQVTSNFYETNAFQPTRIESITVQLRQICYSGCNNILEIGVGRGFLKHCLQLFPQVNITTLDIAEDLFPDRIGSVTNIPFGDKEFELVVCAEVLEHLPFSDFLIALKEIKRVAREKAIISLPDKRRHFGVAVCLARLNWILVEWNPARRQHTKKDFIFNGEHYWEIGCKGSLGIDVIKQIKKAGFKIEKQYRLWKHPWHCFFILKP